MKIMYHGQMKDTKHNTRVAAIYFSEKEEKLAHRIIDLMEKVTPWKCSGYFEDFVFVGVDDKADFEDFKEWYKETKQMFKNCEKFGF